MYILFRSGSLQHRPLFFVWEGAPLAAADVWHEIEIVHIGSRITVEFDDQKLLDIEDATFTEAGKIWLWTKADAATAFDDFEAEKETVDRGRSNY